MGQICQHFLDHQQTRKGGRHRPHLNIGISLDDLATGVGGTYTDTGEPVSPSLWRCSSVMPPTTGSCSPPSQASWTTGAAPATWPVDVYNAIALRDAGCRIGGCDAPQILVRCPSCGALGEGGDTSVTNGLMACRRHHRLVHTPGYSVKLLPDGTVELTHPDGRVESANRADRCPNTSGDNPPAAEPAAPSEPSPTGRLQRVQRTASGAPRSDVKELMAYGDLT